MSKKREKSGELTTQQIVLMIILITSFVVMLFLLFRLNLQEQTQDQICHNSVVLKGKSVTGFGNLNCKTNYVCISGGDECKEITPTRTIDVNPQDKNQVLKAIADEMANCWWMFGEGKIDYVGLNTKGATIGEKNCAVCSIVSFDSGTKQILKDETFGSLYDYLSSNKKENSQTYLYYLTKKSTYDKTNPFNSKKMDEGEYVIITGIAKQGALNSIKNFAWGSVDSFNNVFFSFYNAPKQAEYKDYGPFPVVIYKKSDLNDLGCDQFVTKA